jgi:hypothetical protein
MLKKKLGISRTEKSLHKIKVVILKINNVKACVLFRNIKVVNIEASMSFLKFNFMFCTIDCFDGFGHMTCFVT